MGRRSIPSASLLAAVRTYFGLTQDELAAFLGIPRAFVSHIEAGRSSLPPDVYDRLLPLARCLPPAPAPGTPRPVPAPPPAPPVQPITERGLLEARLDYCQYHAARWRRALRPFERRARAQARWQAALPALLAALPPDPGAAEAPARQWLLARAAPLSAAAVAEWHRLRLRAEALEYEAAALAALLAS